MPSRTGVRRSCSLSEVERKRGVVPCRPAIMPGCGRCGPAWRSSEDRHAGNHALRKVVMTRSHGPGVRGIDGRGAGAAENPAQHKFVMVHLTMILASLLDREPLHSKCWRTCRFWIPCVSIGGGGLIAGNAMRRSRKNPAIKLSVGARCMRRPECLHVGTTGRSATTLAEGCSQYAGKLTLRSFASGRGNHPGR
jgi:hypothetical protein